MPKSLQHNIARFYDDASALWEGMWGEHMHHGYYGYDGREEKDHQQAQVDMIEALLGWGGVTAASRILDVGCGIGGSSLYLARKFGAHVTGITLSERQAARARERAAEAGLSAQTRFEVADALSPPFEPESFDLVWSLESGEHMPNKRRFVQACTDMLEPNGKFLMIAWCHRPVPPALTVGELAFLQRLYRIYHLPYLISIESFGDIAHKVGLAGVATADWTAAVTPFWQAVVRSALSVQGVRGLLRAGWPTLRGAYAMNYMIRGYRSGLIRFGALQGVKP